MVEQPNLYRGRSLDVEDLGEPKKLKWIKQPTFWKTMVYNTRKEHVCSRCEKIILKDNRAEITVDVKDAKPPEENFKKAQYWHSGGTCPK